LLTIAKQFSFTVVQRLGFLLEEFTNLDVEPLYQWLRTQNIRPAVLMSGKNYRKYKQNKRWKVWINEKVEPDL